MDVNNYIYDRGFNGNILIVRQMAFGKITFVQNLAKNKIFRNLKEVY